MEVLVRVLSGPEAGRTVPLRAGQVARFGRTEWADFGFPSDPRLGEVHFELRCGPAGEVVLRNLDAAGTLVDGVPVAESPLRPGQKISAGQTVFAVTFGPGGGLDGRSVDKPAPGPKRPGIAPFTETGTAAAICGRFSPETDPSRLPPADASPDAFLASLVAAGALRDALRFQSFRFPKRHAVWWAWRCMNEPPGPPADPASAEALEAAGSWLADPSDEAAARAGAAAEALGYGPAPAWVAAAAFWSGENIAPPVTSAVAPPDHLTGTAVSAAVLLGAIGAKPEETAARQRVFLEIADRIRRGDDGPPEPGPKPS